MDFVRQMDWGMNTDLRKVFDRMLDLAVEGRLPPEKMIKRIFMFSEMEFDAAGGGERESLESDKQHRKFIRQKLMQANQTMWKTLKCAEVWKPCIFTFATLALSFNIQEGMFYWYTDSHTGPSFSQKNISFNYSIGSVGSLLGVLLYQNLLKDYPFRCLLFWTQLLSSILGFLDLILVLRLNLKLGIKDYIFMVISEAVSQMVGRVKWMPILVLSSQLCPIGIEGTFFALLMSIDHVGLLISSWGGGLMLQLLKVTRTEFGNLWMSILIRNILRLLPLLLLNLVPKNDQNSMVQSDDYFVDDEAVGAVIS